MPSKSKTKGNAWELEVSKFLTETFNETFIRIPSSGAFVGGKNSSRKDMLGEAQLQSKKGDIHPPQTWKYWNIECKNYADFPFHQLWYADVKILDAWIQQQKDVEDQGDLNLILIKITRKEKWVLFPAALEFQTDRFMLYKGWKFTHWNQFWNQQVNRDLVKHYSIEGVGSIDKISHLSLSPALQTCLT